MTVMNNNPYVNQILTHLPIKKLFYIGITLLLCFVTLMATITNNLVIMNGILLLLIISILSFIYPEMMLIVVIFLSLLISPDMAIKTPNLPRLGPSRLLLVSFLSGWVLNLWLCSKHEGHRRFFPILGLISLYLLSCGVSALFSVSRITSFYAVIQLIFEQFTPFFLIVYFIRSPSFWPRLRTAIFFATAIVCLLAFYEAIFHHNPFDLIYPDALPEFRAGLFRVRSVFFHPIALASFINLVFPFLVIEWLGCRNSLKKIAIFSLLFIMLATSILTVSRGPWICLVIEMLILAVWWSWRHLYRQVAMGVALAVISMILVFSYAPNSTLDRLFTPLMSPQKQADTSSEYYRVALVEAVFQRLHGARWIYGFGPNAFHLASVETTYAGQEHTLQSPDNHYIRILLEFGILGTFFFVLLMMAIIAKCIKTIRRTAGDNRSLALACLVAIVGFILVNTTVSLFREYPLTLMFWTAVAIAVAPHSHETPVYLKET